MSKEAFEAFRANQDGVYGKFGKAQEGIPAAGVQVDEKGTQTQSGFLVAWRPKAQVAYDIAEYSTALSEVVPAVRYGYDGKGLDNAHITAFDWDVQPGRTGLSHEDPKVAETLDTLVAAVKQGIDTVGTGALAGARVQLDGALHNGSVGIIPGQGSYDLFSVRQQVASVATTALNSEKPLGAWGAHSTISRVQEERGPESDDVSELVRRLGAAPHIGNTLLGSLDVGYFNTDPVNGFVFTPYESFQIPAGTQISMVTK